ncbi:hypothetical protein CDCA_CDCA03G0929 [Cyanidium caldarium]|uniref:CobW C-terminal domain-containing protein n=1 Tax=Cyanidium caldarium TaxID=2771 RepID=A0AAV9IRX8_CYACA|nr:hypothetical protein CDCA_CDCA03G0929 [Cyanidium caldarium]
MFVLAPVAQWRSAVCRLRVKTCPAATGRRARATTWSAAPGTFTARPQPACRAASRPPRTAGFLHLQAADASAATEVDDRIPVSILTGFLGSGKSTLLNRILSAEHGKRFAVIENEFGEVGIDDDLVRKHALLAGGDELFEMNNGCICCTVRTDLIRILTNLLQHEGRFDGILIETTGMANPAPVVQTFLMHEDIAARFRLDGIITVVDAKHVEQHLDESDGVAKETVEQIAFADRLLLNKTDLVDAGYLRHVQGRLRALNATAPILPCTHADVPLDRLIDMHAFDLERITERDPTFLAMEATTEAAAQGGHDHEQHGEHGHGDEEHHHHEHDRTDSAHDSTITSVGITEPGELDVDRLNQWLSALLEERGADIYRMKGILNIRGTDRRFVFQGVHMMFESMPLEPWGDQPRINKLVFIGRDLDREKLTHSFRMCLADAMAPADAEPMTVGAQPADE